jgi:broad specificity phosphatase PhoE
MELVLIRHGRVAGNPFRPADDVGLSEVGYEQARRLATHLAQEPLYDALVCSPLSRAKQTAEVIGAQLALPAQPIADLREMRRDDFWRLISISLASRLPIVRQRPQVRDQRQWPLVSRAGQISRQLLDGNYQGRVLVVSHGGFIWGALVYWFPERQAEFTRQRQVGNCSLTRIHLDDSGARLVCFNETKHLGDAVTF